ncbi:hypothetical protein ACLBKU_12940 [Erythrobacter sp. NE805]|uniref:hypothetical protein n=1 Tax=Erythrobacter sp. NE805 TaxID=3389875 RepID=UPI00396B2212
MRRLALALACALAAPVAAQTAPEAPPRAAPPAPPPPDESLAATEVARWTAPEARQGVAVDARHFYAVVNSRIGKYRKSDGAKLAEWVGDRIAIRHLNSCVALKTELVCANSNYPETPMASSVEVFDTRTMKHLRSVPLGVRDGSLTWIERRGPLWWALLANYDPPRSHLGRTHRDTRIMLLNDAFAEVGGYALPDSVLTRLAPHSVSGGSFGPDGLLYLTGHDAPEFYVLRIPREGPVLEHVATIAAPIEGQAWAWDRSAGRTIYAITRRSGEVVVLRMPEVRPAR